MTGNDNSAVASTPELKPEQNKSYDVEIYFSDVCSF